MALEKLEAPPIAEVICGVAFEPVAGLDPLTIGWYALERREDYPSHQIQPPITDPGVLLVGPTSPVRAWLISPDEEFLLQIQHDRFFLNWRARGSHYPRFNEHDGKPGILQQVLKEFGRFKEFCIEQLGAEPFVRRTELAKVDHLVAGVHWDGADDLGEALPALVPLFDLDAGGTPSVAFNVTGTTPLGNNLVSVTMQKRSVDGKPRDVVILESRSIGQSASNIDVQTELIQRNAQVNGLFEKLIPEEQRAKRFGGRAK